MFSNLRPKQQEMLGILGRADVPVTMNDLQHVMGYRADTSVRHHLRVLESFGLVQPRRKYEHRSVQLSTRGKMLAKEAAA